MIRGTEACDDGDTSAGDGCNGSCALELGWDCDGEPTVCIEICGDGRRVGTEACDDGNTNPDDGCSPICQLETGWGTGADGPLIVVDEDVINTVRASVSGTAGARVVTISNLTGELAVGMRVLLHQTQAASGAVGQFEYGRIAGIAGASITLGAALTNTYTTDGTRRAQIVAVPELTTVTVRSGGTLTAPPWNGDTGGILAFDATGAVTVEAGGNIQMDERGFRGRNHACTYRCARGYQGESELGLGGVDIATRGMSGGAGGAGQDCGAGGGGGHGASGAAGSNGGCGICAEACPIPGGRAGAAGADNLTSTVLFGGAGGEGGADEDGGNPGRGGHGGGIVLIRAASVTVAGSLRSNGGSGVGGDQGACGGVGCGMGGGGGGGGAGGAIRIETRGAVDFGAARTNATGAGGGACTCGGSPGGTGAVGRIGVRAPSVSGSTSPAFSRL
jgi:cysteine-rich repeat protein